MSEKNTVSYFRNFIFGVEDGLVSTVGFLAGISVVGVGTKELFLSGLVLVCVEAFSMAAGSFLSEESAGEYEEKKPVSSVRAFASSGVMFGSYFVAGLIPLMPYILLPREYAIWVSVFAALLALATLGVIGATFSNISPWKGAIRASVVGGLAIGLGMLVGSLSDALPL